MAGKEWNMKMKMVKTKSARKAGKECPSLNDQKPFQEASIDDHH